MKILLTILIAAGLTLTACVSPLSLSSSDASLATPAAGSATPSESTPQLLTVFAAASLTDAFSEIGKNFESAHPGVTVTFNFAGSQALRTQLEQGAQADVFAPANTKEMDTLIAENFVTANSARIFLRNQLVIILPADNPAGLTELSELSKKGLKIVLAAKEVPVGNYSLQMLDKLDQTLGAGFKDNVLANVVSYENDVRQVLAKVQLGEADAGIVYVSDAVAAPDLRKIYIPTAENVIAQYPIAALTGSPRAELAQQFIAYVLSVEGQTVLRRWGFQAAP